MRGGRVVAAFAMGGVVLLGGAACGSRSTAPTVTVTAAPTANAGTQGTAGTVAPETGAGATSRAPTAATPLPAVHNAARILTESGKTTCNVRADIVECQSNEFGKTYRAKTGEPASGFVYRAGELAWYYGNMAVTDPATTIRYGGTYSAFGWTVTASPDKTVFTRDGHGVSVDVANTTTF